MGLPEVFTPWHPRLSSIQGQKPGAENMVGALELALWQGGCELKTLNCGISCPAAAFTFLIGQEFYSRGSWIAAERE